MVEDTETRTKGSRKGKNTQVQVDNDATNKNEPEAINNEADEDTDSDSDFDDGDKRYNFRTLAKLLEPVPKLTSRNYYSWSAHVKSVLQSVPHAMKHLEGTYDKKHPKWSCSLDDALINALRGTIDTTEWLECNLHGECSLHGDHGHGGLGPYARRSKHRHIEDRAQGACRRLPLRGSRDKSQRNRHRSKEEEQCIGDRQAGPEEEEQCRRSRHSSRRTGVVLEGPPVQYSTKKVLSGERAGAVSLATL
ncbi:uncharacterized protein UHOD_12218 [Ustilago sp. UG-2017b]|nr:uncharacterized protein UHOD_12218 [Ustilago sp. UG-2017b]